MSSTNGTGPPIPPPPATPSTTPVVTSGFDPNRYKDIGWSAAWDNHGGYAMAKLVIENICDKDVRDKFDQRNRCKFDCGSQYHICCAFFKQGCEKLDPIHKHLGHDEVPDSYDGYFVHIPPKCRFEENSKDIGGCKHQPGACMYTHHKDLVEAMNQRIDKMASGVRLEHRLENGGF